MTRPNMLTFGALIAATTLATTPASAQTMSPSCGPHQAVVERLATGYGESRQSIALGANNTVVETYASLETGTWTIVVTTPGGPTCLVAAGQAFQLVNEDLAQFDPEA